MNIKIITHYDEEDIEFTGDYYSIDIYINNNLVKKYGDYYHDKGCERIVGFLDCLKFLNKEFKIERINIADGEYY